MSIAHCPPPEDEPISPCIGVCAIHPRTLWCRGCFRTLEEISGWGEYSPEQKWAVLAEVPGRQQALDGTFLES